MFEESDEDSTADDQKSSGRSQNILHAVQTNEKLSHASKTSGEEIVAPSAAATVKRQLNGGSDSESDVPDVEGWTNKSKVLTKTRTTTRASAAAKKKEKQPKAKTSGKTKVAPQSQTNEFESGLTRVIDATVTSSRRDDDDRDCDSDDGADILDCVASGDWSRIKKIEQGGKTNTRTNTNIKQPHKTAQPVAAVTSAEVTSRQLSDNQKRLASVNQRRRENAKQHSIVSEALQSVDVTSQRSNRIRFDSDDDDEQDSNSDVSRACLPVVLILKKLLTL